MVLLAVIACGLLSIVYAIWATQSVLAADQGNARMQEIAGAIREGAQAYLNRQYTTIAIVGVIVFIGTWFLLTAEAAFGFLIAVMGCYHGYYSGRGAQGVGRATTNAVVSASILILSFNYFITELFFAR